MKERTVLVVDDDEGFIEVIQKRMDGGGYKCLGAYSANQALELFRKEGPSVIVVDYKLPDLDGLALAREIRKINRDIPIIMITGFPGHRVFRRAEEVGINQFILKLRIGEETSSALRKALERLLKGGS